MKIKRVEVEIECNAEELRQSNTLSDAFFNAFRKAFNGSPSYEEDEEEEEEQNHE